MRTVLYKNLPPARHNKNAVFQVSDRDGQMYRSDGEFWAPITEQLTPGAQVVEAVVNPLNGRLRISFIDLVSRLSVAVSRALAGNGRLKIACLGDSITAGTWSGDNGSWGQVQANNYQNVLAKLLSARGFTASASAFFGDRYRTAIDQMSTVDPRLSPGAGWILDGSTSLGGNPYSQSAAGGAFSFTETADTFDVWYVKTGSTGTMAVDVDGGTATTFSTSGSGIAKQTISTTNAQHTINVKWNSGGKVILLGIDAYVAASTKTSIWCMGASGSTAGSFVSWSSGQGHSPINALKTMAPDLTIIGFGVNEWLQGISPSVYAANMQQLIDAAKVSGDVVLLLEPPSLTTGGTGDWASRETQDAIIATAKSLAASNGCLVADVYGRWGTAEKAVSLGLIGDGRIHPNRTGHADLGRVIDDAVFRYVI